MTNTESTRKQRDYIRTLAEQAGYEDAAEACRKHSVTDRKGQRIVSDGMLARLTKSDASDLIDALLDEIAEAE
jgi:hypothetical protein